MLLLQVLNLGNAFDFSASFFRGAHLTFSLVCWLLTPNTKSTEFTHVWHGRTIGQLGMKWSSYLSTRTL